MLSFLKAHTDVQKHWLLALLALCCALYVTNEQALQIWESWKQEEYSYGYLIPPIALWLGLHHLYKTPSCVNPSWWGVVIASTSLFVWALAEISGIPNLPQYGLLGLLYGLFLTFCGISVSKRTWMALVYLFFAIPLPVSLYLSLSSKMQLLSSDLGVSILQLLGIPVFQDGNVIDLGAMKLQVVEACSGLRYLFPLVSFSFLFAALMEDALWKRWILFLSSIPLAIGFNAVRIATIGLVAAMIGTEEAVELVHDLEGWVAFFFCVAILFAESHLLLKIGPQGYFADEFFSVPQPPFFKAYKLPKGFFNPAAISCIMLLCVSLTYGLGILVPKQEIIPPHKIFSSFSTVVGKWTGSPESLSKEVTDLLRATDILNMNYIGTSAMDRINVFIAYYDSQRNERTFHSPSVCLPGGGWTINNERIVSEQFSTRSNRPLRYNRLVIEKGGSRQLAYYWYEQRGVSEPTLYGVKIRIILDSMKIGRSDGAIVRVITQIQPDETEEDADRRLKQFLKELHPVLRDYIPDYSQS